jgi:hypothetical protein
MGNVVDFTAYRLGEVKKPLTPEEIEQDATDFLLRDWEKMARNNRLNDYFRSSLPNLIDQQGRVNYMSDLNEVAALELNIEHFPMVFFPGTLHRKQHGWVVKFQIGDFIIATPELASEAYSRCFAILLHIKLKKDLRDAGFVTG